MGAFHSRTLHLHQSYLELVSLLQHLLSPPLNECIKSRGKLRHATAQVFKSEINTGERISHGGGVG